MIAVEVGAAIGGVGADPIGRRAVGDRRGDASSAGGPPTGASRSGTPLRWPGCQTAEVQDRSEPEVDHAAEAARAVEAHQAPRAGSDAATTASGGSGRAGDVVGRWFTPLARPETWAAFAYLVVGVLAGLVGVVVALVVVSLVLTLVLTVVGVPLAGVVLGSAAPLGAADRSRARWVGVDIEGRPVAPPARGVRVPGWAALVDPERWRVIGHLFAAPVVFPLLLVGALAAVLVPAALVSLPLWGWAVGFGVPTVVAAVAAGVVLVGAAARLVVLLGRAGARFVEATLGEDRLTTMARRVDDLTRQREEILAAVLAERRRIERNLHDGVQPRLVALGIDLGLASSKVRTDPDGAAALLADATDKVRTAIGELRVIARGLHPAVLDDRGLDAALSGVIAASTVPIRLDVETRSEVPVEVAETAYYVVSEAVANIMKHSSARAGSVRVTSDEAALLVTIHDDGRGGADAGFGTGLAGMRARVEGADGRFDVDSPPGGPTVVTARIPLRPPGSSTAQRAGVGSRA